MSRRILILNPWGIDNMDQPALDVAAAYARPDTDFEVRNLGPGAPPLPWPHAEQKDRAVEVARQAEADGFDGIVIGCSADPFLSDIRGALDIPVTAPVEAAVHTGKGFGKFGLFARLLSEEYLPLIPTQGNWDFWNGTAQRYGLSPDEYALRRVFVPKHPTPQELHDLTAADPARLRDLTIEAMTEALLTDGVEQARAAIEEDGVKVLYFACAFWSPGIEEIRAEAEKRFGAPVLNTLGNATSFMEHTLIATGK